MELAIYIWMGTLTFLFIVNAVIGSFVSKRCQKGTYQVPVYPTYRKAA